MLLFRVASISMAPRRPLAEALLSNGCSSLTAVFSTCHSVFFSHAHLVGHLFFFFYFSFKWMFFSLLLFWQKRELLLNEWKRRQDSRQKGTEKSDNWEKQKSTFAGRIESALAAAEECRERERDKESKCKQRQQWQISNQLARFSWRTDS